MAAWIGFLSSLTGLAGFCWTICPAINGWAIFGDELGGLSLFNLAGECVVLADRGFHRRDADGCDRDVRGPPFSAVPGREAADDGKTVMLG